MTFAVTTSCTPITLLVAPPDVLQPSVSALMAQNKDPRLTRRVLLYL